MPHQQYFVQLIDVYSWNYNFYDFTSVNVQIINTSNFIMCKTRISNCLSITHFLKQTPKCGVGNTAIRKGVHRKCNGLTLNMKFISWARHDFSYFHKNKALDRTPENEFHIQRWKIEFSVNFNVLWFSNMFPSNLRHCMQYSTTTSQ